MVPGLLGHDDLASDLAAFLSGDNRMTWTNMQLGPAGSPRPDVYAVFKSYTRPTPTSYEVKVSRPDFLSDVTSGKWTEYLKYSSAVVFACQGDLIKKSEVPEHCGLIVLRSSWRLAKRPVINPVVVPQDALLKLLIDGVRREGPVYRQRVWSESGVMDNLSKKFGQDVANTVRDLVAACQKIRHAENEAKYIIEAANRAAGRIRMEAVAATIEPARAELCEALGLKKEASHWDIRAAVEKIRRDGEESPYKRSLRNFTEAVHRALNRYGHMEEVTAVGAVKEQEEDEA